jgi:hypothetical protein
MNEPCDWCGRDPAGCPCAAMRQGTYDTGEWADPKARPHAGRARRWLDTGLRWGPVPCAPAILATAVFQAAAGQWAGFAILAAASAVITFSLYMQWHREVSARRRAVGVWRQARQLSRALDGHRDKSEWTISK